MHGSQAVRMQAMGFLATPPARKFSGREDEDEGMIAARKASERNFILKRKEVYNTAFFSSPAIVQAMQQVYEDWVGRQTQVRFHSAS